MAVRNAGTPGRGAYWFWPPRRARIAASITSGGPSESGNPWPRLIAAVRAAKAVISVNTVVPSPASRPALRCASVGSTPGDCNDPLCCGTMSSLPTREKGSSQMPDALDARQQELCDTAPWDFSDLRAVYVNCTLKRSPEVSNPEGLADLSIAIMRRLRVTVV